MLMVSYDFANDRTRREFAKFLKKVGGKVQYSVYELKNSRRILQNTLHEIESDYKKRFENTDSILIFPLCESCQKKIVRYGSAVNLEKDVIFFK